MNNIYLFLLFFFTVLTLFFGMQLFIFRRFRRWANKALTKTEYKKYKLAFFIWLIFGNLLFLFRFVISRIGSYDSWWGQIIAYGNGMFFASVLFGFLIMALWMFGRFQYKMIATIVNRIRGKSKKRAISKSRREFIKRNGQIVMAVITATPIITALATSRNYKIIRKTLHYEDLPSGLDGFSFVQISDLHSGIYMTEKDMHLIFEIVNSLHPQMIFITGDFADSSPSEIPSVARAITDLKAEYGVYGVLGNHDHYAGADKVYNALETKINMLRNSHISLVINGAKLSIIGVDDAGSGSANHADLPRALSGIDQDSFKLLLSHRPGFFDQSGKTDIDLTLSGHTHGGQVAVKIFGFDINPAALVHDYVAGLYESGRSKLYVNVGVGMVGAPIRLVRPEITVLTLKKAQ